MAQGLDAVKAALIRGFGEIEIHEGYDIDTKDRILSFEADLLPYQVRITAEYDDDYASGQVNSDLISLADMLRNSKSGKVKVIRTGFISK